MLKNSVFVQASCLIASCGFVMGVMTSSCTKGQQSVVKEVIHFNEVACDIAKDVSPDAKEVCVTEDELRKAIRDIVSNRKTSGGASGKGVAVVRVK